MARICPRARILASRTVSRTGTTPAAARWCPQHAAVIFAGGRAPLDRRRRGWAVTGGCGACARPTRTALLSAPTTDLLALLQSASGGVGGAGGHPRSPCGSNPCPPRSTAATFLRPRAARLAGGEPPRAGDPFEPLRPHCDERPSPRARRRPARRSTRWRSHALRQRPSRLPRTRTASSGLACCSAVPASCRSGRSAHAPWVLRQLRRRRDPGYPGVRGRLPNAGRAHSNRGNAASAAGLGPDAELRIGRR